MTKKTFYSELAYLIGLLVLAFGTSLMTVADLGLSMIVAPAYILHLKISEFLPFFSFGMAEYTFQALLILITVIIIRRFRVSYLFSFATAVLYGIALDSWLLLTTHFSSDILALRILLFVVGTLMCTFGVALLFRTYISPEAYELIVKEVSKKFNFNINHVKTVYDISSLVLSVTFSFIFFGLFEFHGIYWGTLVSAMFNGLLIGLFGKMLDKLFVFKDKLSLRNFFESTKTKKDS